MTNGLALNGMKKVKDETTVQLTDTLILCLTIILISLVALLSGMERYKLAVLISSCLLESSLPIPTAIAEFRLFG